MALVAIAVTVGIVGVTTQGGSDAPESTPTPAAGETTQDPSPSSPSSPSTSAAPTDTGVFLWAQQFVYACRLVAPADVARVFGPSGSKGYVRQQYLDRTPTSAELSGASAFGYGGLATRCTHWFDDLQGHQLDVVVTQFPTQALADRRLATLLRSKGRGATRQPAAAVRVPGTEGRLLFVAGERSFLVTADDLIVEVRYATDRSLRSPRPLSEAEVDRQVELMKRVVRTVDQHLADGEAVFGPVKTTAPVEGTVGGTPYVEPCRVLGTAEFSALGGPPPEPVVVDTSVIRHDPWSNAAVSSCERSGIQRDGGARKTSSTFAVLEVRVAPDAATAQKVLEQHLENRYPRGTDVGELTTDAGTAYVIDIPRSKKDSLRTRVAHVVVGEYELRLAAVLDVGPKKKSGRPPTDEELVATLDALAEALEGAA